MDSEPTFSARQRSAPVWFTEPPITGSPTFFSTGIDSPVTIDSSTADPHPKARAEGNGCAQGHQRVHVGPSLAEGTPGAAVVRAPDVHLERGRQRQLRKSADP